jgi:hypothetical protein
MTTAGPLAQPNNNGLIIPSLFKLGAPRKTLMDLSVIKEELSKLAISEQSGDDMQKTFKHLVKALFRPYSIFHNLGGGGIS